MRMFDLALVSSMALCWSAVATVTVAMLFAIVRGINKAFWRLHGANAFYDIRWPLKVAASGYPVAGFFLGLTFKLLTPAMTWWGVGYFVVVWPIWLLQPITGIHPPIPHWMFNFEGF